MSDLGTVTAWIEGARKGDQSAIRSLFEYYFERLTSLATKKLQQGPKWSKGPEDAALTVMEKFTRKIQQQDSFSKLENREDVAKLLAKMIGDRVKDYLRAAIKEQKAFKEYVANLDDKKVRAGLTDVFGREPTPETQLAFAELCEKICRRLSHEGQGKAFLLRLQGHTYTEIARELDVSPRTIERWQPIIRSVCDKVLAEQNDI